jgi:hypothetical protein
MNGLTAANVDGLVDAIKKTHANCLALERREAARALADVLFVIHQLREKNTTQPGRPDRVGDECWYALWDVDNGRWDWKRGIFRGICDRSYPFVAEDAITKSLELCLHVNFSTEAPK